MVEALVVISIMILFFLGMVYFDALYAQKLRVMSLARSATVAYAINGCQGDPLGYIEPQIGTLRATPSVPGGAGGTVNFITGNTPPQIGLSSFSPAEAWLSSFWSNYSALQATEVDITGHVTASTRGTSGAGTTFQASPATASFALCGDQRPGTPGDYPNVVAGIVIRDAFPF
jgi:hypothetical protein